MESLGNTLHYDMKNLREMIANMCARILQYNIVGAFNSGKSRILSKTRFEL